MAQHCGDSLGETKRQMDTLGATVLLTSLPGRSRLFFRMAILAREKELATAVFIFVNLGSAKEKHLLFWVKAHRATTLLELVWNIFKDGWEAGWMD